jgi:alpha-1,2-mannosyltransferase
MRSLIALALGLVTGIFAFVAGMGLTGSSWGAAVVALVAVGLAGFAAERYLLGFLDEGACSGGLKIVSGVAALGAIAALSRLAVFILDPSQVACSLMPTSAWEVQHSCLSAYYVSAQAASSAPDPYADSLFNLADDDPTKLRKPLRIGPFRVDVYEYPPSYLLLPRALMLLAPEFLRMRMLWFGVCGGAILLAFLAVVRLMSAAAGTRALLLSPLVWLSFPMLSNLQKGNVQATVVAGSMLAMVLLERRRHALGGALLAFMAMSKIYPGMLVFFLVAQRRWRALGWTVAAGFAILAVSMIDTGWTPYAAFLRHLPGILGGEAFPAFRNPMAMAINFSIPGLAFKAKLFGVPGMGFPVSKFVGWAYTLFVIAVTVLAGRRATTDGDRKPIVWLAILLLATLRSPFLPQAYAAIPPLWLLTLLAALVPPTRKVLAVVVVTWAALNLYWPLDWPVDPRWLAAAFFIPQTLTFGIALWALRRDR